MDNKVINSLILIFSVFGISSCLAPYTSHFESYHQWAKVSQNDVFKWVSELLVLPDINVKKALLSQISLSRERIWIEIYTWTDKELLEAVIDAKKRWVDVRVILEPSVYGTPTINRLVFESLKSQDIPVVYSSIHNFVFTHAKFFLIDDTYYISTWNFTHSFFTKNRDLILSWKDIPTKEFLEGLFLRDFEHLGTENLEIPWYMVISPINSRARILKILHWAKKEVVIYTQTLQDEEILGALLRNVKDQVSVEVCTAENDANKETQKREWQFDWTTLGKPYPHLKLMLIDQSIIFLWSQNFTSNSLDNNREVGIIIQENPELFRALWQIYQKDCKE